MSERLEIVSLPSSPTRAFCNECSHETNHKELVSHRREHNENIGDQIVTAYEALEIIQCLGCESIKVRRMIERTDSDQSEITYFPPADWRRAPSWISKAPTHIHALLSQVYSAMCIGWNRLAALGTRAVIDDIILDEIGDQGSFQNKLRKLVENDLMSQQEVELIGAALEPGHAAMHRGLEPEDHVMEMVVDVVESLVRKVYVLRAYPQLILDETPERAEL